MNFHLPTSSGKIENQAGIIQIKSFRRSHLLLFLSEEAVYIRDSSKLGCPIISQFTRPSESIDKFGVNLWCEWIEENVFAYGTEHSEIFFSEITSDNKINNKSQLNIKHTILSTFSAHDYLGVCTSNSKIIMVSSSSQITRVFELDGADSITSAKFTYPDTLTLNKNGTPIIIYLTKEAIESGSQLIYNYEKDKNASIIEYNQYNTEYAIATSNGSVILAKAGSASVMRFEVTGPCKDPVTFLKWIDNSLLIIRASGNVALFTKQNSNIIKTNIPELNEAYDIEFDVYGQQLFYTTYEKIGLIYLSSIQGQLVIEPTNVKYGPTMEVVISLTNNSKAEIPPEMFPIQKAVYQDEKTFAIGNKNGFMVFAENESSKYIKYPLINMEIVSNYIIVFRKKESYEADICNFKGKRLANILLDHPPLSISVVASRLCVGGEFVYTIVDIVPAEREVKVDSVNLENDQKAAVYVMNNNLYIEQIAMTCFGDIITLDEFNNVLDHKRKMTLASDAHGLQTDRNTGSILLQCANGIYVYSKYNNLYYFKHKALMADSISIYYADDFEFNKFSLKKQFWVSFMMAYNSEEDVFNETVNLCQTSPDFPFIACDTILHSFDSNEWQIAIDRFQAILSDNELSITLRNVISRLRPEHSQLLHAYEGIQWERILPLCTPEWIGAIIARLTPKLIKRLAQSEDEAIVEKSDTEEGKEKGKNKIALNIKSFQDPKASVQEICKRCAIFPAAIFAETFNIPLEKCLIDVNSVKLGLSLTANYSALLTQPELERLSKLILQVAQKKKMPICELCMRWIIKDKMYVDVLAKNPGFQKEFEEFVQTQ